MATKLRTRTRANELASSKRVGYSDAGTGSYGWNFANYEAEKGFGLKGSSSGSRFFGCSSGAGARCWHFRGQHSATNGHRVSRSHGSSGFRSSRSQRSRCSDWTCRFRDDGSRSLSRFCGAWANGSCNAYFLGTGATGSFSFSSGHHSWTSRDCVRSKHALDRNLFCVDERRTAGCS